MIKIFESDNYSQYTQIWYLKLNDLELTYEALYEITDFNNDEFIINWIIIKLF